jgi:hypothetical protein
VHERKNRGVRKMPTHPSMLRLTADGRTLFVTNFGSRTLEMIDVTRAVTNR